MALPTESQLRSSLERIRPYLAADGGDVELVRITENGIVEVRLAGSCLECPMSILTLRAGIERALLLEYEDVKRIEQVR